jgi:cytochrome c oxidase subunit II
MKKVLVVLATLVVCWSCGGNQVVLNPQGPVARSIAHLSWVLFALSGIVYALVLAAALWAIGRRRRESDDSPQTTRALTRTVTGAAVLTAVILVVLALASVTAERGLTQPSGRGAVEVDVIGHQWWWDFQYRDVTPSDTVASPNELHIPVGVPVVLRVMSKDVIHTFWVPNLHGKRDLVPGQVTYTWIQADTPGVYRGQCAEFCGYQHAHMSFLVVAQPMDEFLKWIQHQRQPAPEPVSAEQQRGRDLFMGSTCVTCHTIRGTAAGSRVGPELTHVASRQTIAAGTLPNTREHLGEWIRNSQAIKPGNRMPPSPFAPEQLPAVLSYIRSLR